MSSKFKLGQFYSTAICGNDILSSALYVSGIAILFAGFFAPLVLLAVGFVLIFYRSVYREVVEALPVNGGTYNALLNSTSKMVASIAGVMTILSYIATAVISVKTGVEYLLQFLIKLFPIMHIGYVFGDTTILVFDAVVVILFLFALLVVSGAKDSAIVASIIFGFHILTLLVFVGFGAVYCVKHGVAFSWGNLLATKAMMTSHTKIVSMLFLGFSASLLGISGFESSANFVEEQKKGVFNKTLRNMIIGVMIFNPIIALIALNTLSLGEISSAKDFLLASVSMKLGGLFLLGLVAIDAFLVLCGAALTSYIGVSGLAYRMSLDNVLPKFMAKLNKKGSPVIVIFVFFLLCSSILKLTHGNLLSLAGVYTISFLSVMTLFAISNLIMRVTRKELKRPYQAPIKYVIIAMLLTFAGLLGNVSIDTKNVYYFLTYFVPAIILVVVIMFKRDVLQNLKFFFKHVPVLGSYIEKKYNQVTQSTFFVFLHNQHNIFSALNYINNNESGHNVTFVHCRSKNKLKKKAIIDSLPVLRDAGVFSHLNIKFEYLDKIFNPLTVHEFAQEKAIDKSSIFIGSIHHFHDFDYSDFGGVRIINE